MIAAAADAGAAGRRVRADPAAGAPADRAADARHLRAARDRRSRATSRRFARQCCGSRSSERLAAPTSDERGDRGEARGTRRAFSRRLSSGRRPARLPRGQSAIPRADQTYHDRHHRHPRRRRRPGHPRPAADRICPPPISSSPRTASGRRIDTFTRVSRGGGIGVGRRLARRRARPRSRRPNPDGRLPHRQVKTTRRRRWCSISCRPNRCGWRSGRRSSTCR